MANAITAFTPVLLGATLVSRLGALNTWFEMFQESSRKSNLFQELMDLSDADLAKRNLQRDQIGQYVLNSNA